MKDWLANIEPYFDNELSVEDKLLFENELNVNEDLKYEYLLHKIMLEGIDKSGELELKKYLKENTKIQKKVSLKWMWFASAACILVGLTLYLNFKDTWFQKSSHFTFEDTSQTNNPIENSPKDIIKTDAIAKTDTKTEEEFLNEMEPKATEKIDENGLENAMDSDPSKQLIANVTMVPIQIGNAYSYKPESKVGKKSKAEVLDSELSNDSINNTDIKANFSPTFNVTFLQTDTISVLMRNNGLFNGQYNLQVENASPAESEVLLFNNTYYLKAGNNFFIIDTTKNSVGKKVIEAALINKLRNAN